MERFGHERIASTTMAACAWESFRQAHQTHSFQSALQWRRGLVIGKQSMGTMVFMLPVTFLQHQMSFICCVVVTGRQRQLGMQGRK